jgi:cell division initiation protein
LGNEDEDRHVSFGLCSHRSVTKLEKLLKRRIKVKLTPLDIRKQEFKRTMRGFDAEEVEAFLSMVADELELLLREKNQLNDELIKIRTQLKDYQQVEHTLRDTLVKAQSTIDESRVNSRKEAEIIIHEAELQAENILKEAREELLNLRHEISLVRTQKNSYAARLRHLLESQVELLEVMQMEDSIPEDMHTVAPERKSKFYKMDRPPAQLDDRQAMEKQTTPPFTRPTAEPKIIRGEKKFNEPTPGAPNFTQNPQKGVGEQKSGSNPNKNNAADKISDQFIV